MRAERSLKLNLVKCKVGVGDHPQGKMFQGERTAFVILHHPVPGRAVLVPLNVMAHREL